MKKIYLAPLEGITDNTYRTTFKEFYGGCEKEFTPFLSPNSTKKFTTREFREIDSEINDVNTTVPQLLTNNAECFLWAAEKIAELGYHEINFNLGCPSGTVVAKKKGSGLLFYPELLDQLLYDVFANLPVCADGQPVNISIKTRLGKNDPDEFEEVLEIFNKYPISELTVHPRIQTDFYKEPVREEYFSYGLSHTDIPLVFNGEIKSVSDMERVENQYPDINAMMLGRGLITNPELAFQYKESREPSAPDLERLKAFHNELLAQYTTLFSGDKPVLHRMKELWVFWRELFPNNEKAIKQIQKSKHLAEYKIAIQSIL
jgi:tRNA-dihydrouridine synthase